MLPTSPLLRATAPAGPHLPVAMLRQYAAGTLAGASRHRVEAHTLACPRCADILEGLLQTPPATTDQALAQLQQRLRLRVQQAETARPALPRLGHRWLVPQLAAAATLLFGLLAGGWYTWQQRHATPAADVTTSHSASAPAAPVVSEAPPAASAPASRSATPAVRVSRPDKQAEHLAVSRRRYSPSTGAVVAQPALPAAEPVASTLAPSDSTRILARVTAATPPAATPGRAASPTASGAVASSQPADDSTGLNRDKARVGEVAKASTKKAGEPEGRTRMSMMPAAPAIPPTPAGGYPAWRERIRRKATEFKPREGERPLSGTVQLRLLIGPDGKIQEIKVLYGLREDYDEAAQELVCDSPAWIPGIGGGKRAAQAVEVSVPF